MAGRAERRQDGRRERLAWIIRRASRDESPVTVGAVPFRVRRAGGAISARP